MLYTTRPLERIYSNQVQSLIISRFTDEERKNELISLDVEHGKVYARREGDNYIVDGINSTSLDDYLDSKYSPGSIIKW